MTSLIAAAIALAQPSLGPVPHVMPRAMAARFVIDGERRTVAPVVGDLARRRVIHAVGAIETSNLTAACNMIEEPRRHLNDACVRAAMPGGVQQGRIVLAVRAGAHRPGGAFVTCVGSAGYGTAELAPGAGLRNGAALASCISEADGDAVVRRGALWRATALLHAQPRAGGPGFNAWGTEVGLGFSNHVSADCYTFAHSIGRNGADGAWWMPRTYMNWAIETVDGQPRQLALYCGNAAACIIQPRRFSSRPDGALGRADHRILFDTPASARAFADRLATLQRACQNVPAMTE